MLCGNSHQATPVSAGTTLRVFCFYYYLFLKIGCRQNKVLGQVLKQTVKAIFSRLKEKSGRQCGLLLASNTQLQSQE